MLKLLVVLFSLTLILGCQNEAEVDVGKEVNIISSYHSDCLSNRAAKDMEDQERYIVQSVGNHIYKIEHLNATFNCCLPEGIAFFAELKNDSLFFGDYEKVKGNCKCICEYNTSAEIGEIEEGSYELVLTTAESFVGSIQLNFKTNMYVEIPVSDLIESL